MFDTQDAVVLKAELAGMKVDDIQIEVDDNVLTLKGERTFEEKVDEERYYRVERRYGSFQRSLALPQGVKADEIQATYEDGVLEVTRAQGRGREAQAHRGQGGRRRSRQDRRCDGRGRRGDASARPPRHDSERRDARRQTRRERKKDDSRDARRRAGTRPARRAGAPAQAAAGGAGRRRRSPSAAAPTSGRRRCRARRRARRRRPTTAGAPPLAERDQYLDHLQRLKAEFENYRKRVQRDNEALVLRAGEGVIESLLPVVDNMQRALESARKARGGAADQGRGARRRPVALGARGTRPR